MAPTAPTPRNPSVTLLQVFPASMRLEDASARTAEVVDQGLAGNSGCRRRPSAAGKPDVAELEAREHRRIDLHVRRILDVVVVAPLAESETGAGKKRVHQEARESPHCLLTPDSRGKAKKRRRRLPVFREREHVHPIELVGRDGRARIAAEERHELRSGVAMSRPRAPGRPERADPWRRTPTCLRRRPR